MKLINKNNVEKGRLLLVLIILITPFSIAELQPGKLFINNVEIPYTSKIDFEIYLYPRLNVINNDFMIYTKSKDESITQKIFAFIYDNNQNRIKTIELFNDGRAIGYGNFFKMDNIGMFAVKLCIGNSKESCNELPESVIFEVEDFKCNELFEDYNNINADKINMIFLGHGYENEDILKKLSQKILTFDGNPILTNMYDKETNEFVDKQLRWGLFSIEPFKSNKNKFNIWYRLIDESVQNFLEKLKDGKSGYTLCGLKYPYIAVLDQEIFGMIAYYPTFYNSPEISKEDISFGISFNSYDAISDRTLHHSGRFVYYEEVGEQINDLITYTTFSLLPHESGHALIGLIDEYESGNLRHAYPNCAKDINEAKGWWGDLISQVDPFYYEYIRIMQENGINIPRDYSKEDLRNHLKLDYYSGGCGINYVNSGTVRPTYTSMMDDATIPIFGSVNSARIEQVLNLFSGEETREEPISSFYIYTNSQRIAKEENGNLFYFHNDHLGSPAVVTDSVGKVIERIDYMPFGDEITEADSKIKYNSKELDKDTSLLYYGARYYDSASGRFITADTVKGSLVDSQSMNLYIYTKNNPMKYIDPSGNMIWPSRDKLLYPIRKLAYRIALQRNKEGMDLNEIIKVLKHPEKGYYTGGGVDLLGIYLGLKKNPLPISEYEPQSASKYSNLKKYDIKDYMMIQPMNSWDSTLLKKIKQMNEGDIITLYHRFGLKGGTSPFDYKMAGLVSSVGWYGGHDLSLGGYTLSFGKDKKGGYLSILDIWDFEPKSYSLMYGIGTDKKFKQLQLKIMDWIGNPIALYGRIYFSEMSDKEGYIGKKTWLAEEEKKNKIK